jgi:hypothetical protein
MYGPSKILKTPAFFAAINDLVPVEFPFFSPGERALTNRAYFVR